VVRIAALFSLAAAVGAETEPQDSSLPSSDRPVRIVEQLEINGSNAYRSVARDKCEAQGVGEIRGLMTSSATEELWVFLPDRGDDAGCHWIEIGGEARSASEKATIKVDWSYLGKLMATRRELYVYHFHPGAYFERCKSGADCNEYSMPLRAEDVSGEGLVTNLKYAMPSPDDIYFMMEASWQLDQYHHGTGRMRHRVVTPYGVVEYALSDKGKKKYAENRGSRLEGLYIKLVAANSLSEESINGIVDGNRDDLTAALEELARSMNSKNLLVTLVPP
jgi:hypothetical protein